MKKIHMNPILKKELMVSSRSMKMSWAIFGINSLLTIIVIMVLVGMNFASYLSGYNYNSLIWLFPILAVIECALISIIIPIITSGSISGERERQTLDIMLTTPISPFSIAVGKLKSAMAVVMLYMITSIPLMSIAFVLGGLSWWALFGFMALMLYLGIYVGSIGIFCSSVVKKSIAATILTIAIGVAILTVTTVIYTVINGIVLFNYDNITVVPSWLKYGISPLIFLLNPYSPIFDFMMRVMTDGGINNFVEAIDDLPYFLDAIYVFWIGVSVTINLGIAFLFLKLAANNIAVTRNKR